MKRKDHLRILSLFMGAIILLTSFQGCFAEEISQDDNVGDVDELVYGLIVNELKYVYEVFEAEVTLSDGTQIFGIGYTDFSEFYESEDGGGYFPAGFIKLIGEPDIPEKEKESGLEVVDLANESEYSFVLAYDTEPYMEHCVVWNRYLQYGIDEDGEVTYQIEDYRRGYCNEELGALYSYVENRYVYLPDMGDYKYVTGSSLFKEIDYTTIEAEINRIIEEQNRNFSYTEIVTTVTYAKGAICGYLLSLQVETFLGYEVSQLVEMANALDPMECIRLTPNGPIILTLTEDIPGTADELTKWLVGAACVIVIGSTFAVDILGSYLPAGIKALNNAVSGVAIEVFVQVVKENHGLNEVDWRKVAIAAATGAAISLSIEYSPEIAKYIMEKLGMNIIDENTTQAMTYIVSMMMISSIVGTENAVNSLMDGESKEEAVSAFLIGFSGSALIGAILPLGVSAIDKGIEWLGKTKIGGKVVKWIKEGGVWIQDHQLTWNPDGKATASAKFHVTNNAKKEVLDSIDVSPNLKKKIAQLPSDKNPKILKIDPTTRQPITKAEILHNGGNCILIPDDPELIQKFKKNNITELIVRNGDVDFSTIARLSLNVDIGKERSINLDGFMDDLLAACKNDSEIIVKICQTTENIDIKTMSDLENLLKTNNLVRHEGADGVVYLVDSMIHGLISHAGGVSYAKVVDAYIIGSANIDEYLTKDIVEIYGSLIGEVA